MRRILILALVVLVLLLVAAQFALPPLAERAVQDKLTENGGTANVDLDAFPSPRLLFKEGDRIRVRTTGITTPPLDLTKGGTFEDLDGFDEVDILATDTSIGPFRVARITLQRDEGEQNYRATIQATIRGTDLSAFAGRMLGGGLGGFLSGIAGGAMPGAGARIPIDLNAVLRSENGKAKAVSVDGTVAGLPAAPLVEVLTAALAVRF